MKKKITSMKVQRRAVAKVTVPTGQEFNLELVEKEEEDKKTEKLIEKFEEESADSEINLKMKYSLDS